MLSPPNTLILFMQLNEKLVQSSITCIEAFSKVRNAINDDLPCARELVIKFGWLAAMNSSEEAYRLTGRCYETKGTTS